MWDISPHEPAYPVVMTVYGENGPTPRPSGPALTIGALQDAFTTLAQQQEETSKPVIVYDVRLVLPPTGLPWPFAFQVERDGFVYADQRRVPPVVFIGRHPPAELSRDWGMPQ